MDGNHPKRRKDKYNPYTIGTTEDGRHWLTFSDGQGNRHHFEISAAVFTLFDSFELDDLSYLNEVDRHYEQSELMEASLYDRAVHRPATVEESALQSMEYEYARQRDREKSLDELSPDELAQAASYDKYFQDEYVFEVLGQKVFVVGDLLAEALSQLPEDKRDVILLSYFLGMTDREISEQLNVVRQAISKRRSGILKELREYLEKEGFEWPET